MPRPDGGTGTYSPGAPPMASGPAWLSRIAPAVQGQLPDWFREFAPPPDPPQRSAVLVLVAGDDDHADILLTERAAHLRAHAAQVSFPGGRVDPGDDGPVGAALREAQEEVGVRPESVQVVGTLPGLYMHGSADAVTPVLGWWREPHPVDVVDPGEVARVVRADVNTLCDPARRFTVGVPGGFQGPGFDVDGLFVWGFTAKLLDVVLQHTGLARPWDPAVERRLPMRLLAAYLGQRD